MDVKLSAVLMAEGVYNVAGKWTIQGVFRRIQVPELPIQLGAFGVFLSFSDLIAKNKLNVRLEFVDPEAEIDGNGVSLLAKAEGESTNRFTKPSLFDTGVMLGPGIRFERAGIYELRVFVNEEFVDNHTFEVVKYQ